MSFEREWRVRFADADPFGWAHYPHIVEAMHDTADRFVADLGWPFWRLTEEHGLGLPIVEVNADFERPMAYGDLVTISLCTEVGESSVRFVYEGTVDGDRTFAGYEQRVCVPVDGDGSVPLPDEFRGALASAACEA